MPNNIPPVARHAYMYLIWALLVSCANVGTFWFLRAASERQILALALFDLACVCSCACKRTSKSRPAAWASPAPDLLSGRTAPPSFNMPMRHGRHFHAYECVSVSPACEFHMARYHYHLKIIRLDELQYGLMTSISILCVQSSRQFVTHQRRFRL